MKLNDEEKKVWSSVFGAHYATQMAYLRQNFGLSSNKQRWPDTVAKEAAELADEAIGALRAWGGVEHL